LVRKRRRFNFGVSSLSWWLRRADQLPRRGASQLEDLPGDGIGANLPAVVQKSLRESLKLEYQLEALLAGKMPDKGEKNKK